MGKHNTRLGLDLLMIVSLLLIMVPVLLGQTWHEWAGLILGAVLIIHIVIHWKRLKAITLNFHHRLAFRTRFNYILNLVIFAGFAGIIVSGIFMAKTIDFSWLGINRGNGMGWKLLHASASYLTFVLIGIHTGMNFDRVLYTINPVYGQNNKGGSACET